jgi:hypothetical protein
MNYWTEQKALKALNGNVAAHNRQISGSGGFYGLKACSAYDYLCHHCGYHAGNMAVKEDQKEIFDR